MSPQGGRLLFRAARTAFRDALDAGLPILIGSIIDAMRGREPKPKTADTAASRAPAHPARGHVLLRWQATAANAAVAPVLQRQGAAEGKYRVIERSEVIRRLSPQRQGATPHGRE